MGEGLVRPVVLASICAIVLLGAPAALAQGQLEGSGIPYGAGIGAFVQAPKGWIFDSQSGVSQGLHCVMYPQGYTWRTAGEVMYVSTSALDPGQTLAQFMENDAADFRKKSAALEVLSLSPIILASGQEALVRKFTGDRFGSHECIAYAQLGNSVASLTLSCRTAEGYEKSVGPFRDMVAAAALMKMPPADQAVPGRGEAGPAGPGSYGYSHWAGFRAGTTVAFRYTMTSPRASEEMTKTITLKEVTPDFVRLEYRESPPKAAGRTGPATASLYQDRQDDFGEAEEEFSHDQPVESLLGYAIASYLTDPKARTLDSGKGDVAWKGGRLPATWTKLQLGSAAGPMTISVWRSDAVPGGLFRFIREFEGAAASREEVVAEDFLALGASPAEVARLRASRRPIAIEVRAATYFRTRFRSIARLQGYYESTFLTIVRDVAGNSGSTVSFSDVLRNLDLIKVEFEAEKGRVAAELGPQEAAKLAEVLDAYDNLLTIQLDGAQLWAEGEKKAAAGSLDEAAVAAFQAEMGGLVGRLPSVTKRLGAAIDRLSGVSVKFLKNPS